LDAHVTADITEQWVKVALPRGKSFDPYGIAQMVPDCGYQLRRIELQADGELREQSDLPPGSAPQFVVAGSGQRINLAGPVEQRGRVWLTGQFQAPVGEQPLLVVMGIEPR